MFLRFNDIGGLAQAVGKDAGVTPGGLQQRQAADWLGSWAVGPCPSLETETGPRGLGPACSCDVKHNGRERMRELTPSMSPQNSFYSLFSIFLLLENSN
jgi:hypothetical protein